MVPRAIVHDRDSLSNIVVILILALAAVSHHLAPISQPAKNLSACSAITRFDVQFALGRSVSKPEEERSVNTSTCDYATHRGRVTITLQRLDREPETLSEIAALQREIDGAMARPAPAFGENAFFLDIPGGGTQLHVIRGRNYLLVSVLGFGEASVVAPAAEKMARTALSRWP